MAKSNSVSIEDLLSGAVSIEGGVIGLVVLPATASVPDAEEASEPDAPKEKKGKKAKETTEDSAPEADDFDVEKAGLPELKAKAAELGIDLKPRTRQETIRALIVEAQEKLASDEGSGEWKEEDKWEDEHEEGKAKKPKHSKAASKKAPAKEAKSKKKGKNKK